MKNAPASPSEATKSGRDHAGIARRKEAEAGKNDGQPADDDEEEIPREPAADLLHGRPAGFGRSRKKLKRHAEKPALLFGYRREQKEILSSIDMPGPAAKRRLVKHPHFLPARSERPLGKTASATSVFRAFPARKRRVTDPA